MSRIANWQRVLYYLGETLLVVGLLWALYYQFIKRVCPVGYPGVFQPFVVVVLGLALDTLPLHPFGAAPYLRKGLRCSVAGYVWWALVLIGFALSLYMLITAFPGSWWIVALVPALLWYWAAVPSRWGEQRGPPARAPAPPPRDEQGAPEAVEESVEDERRVDNGE